MARRLTLWRDDLHQKFRSHGHHLSRHAGANITFDKVAREWRCKYAADASGGPADSASLKAAEELLQSYLPTLKSLPNAEVTRVMCGGCHDFKVATALPAESYFAWEKKDHGASAPLVQLADAGRWLAGAAG